MSTGVFIITAEIEKQISIIVNNDVVTPLTDMLVAVKSDADRNDVVAF